MKMLSACLLLFPFISCTQVQDTKGDAVIEQKIETLLSSMTLEEKIGQMNQISSYGNIEDMSGLIKKGEVGSILNEVDPVRVTPNFGGESFSLDARLSFRKDDDGNVRLVPHFIQIGRAHV